MIDHENFNFASRLGALSRIMKDQGSEDWMVIRTAGELAAQGLIISAKRLVEQTFQKEFRN